MWLTEAVNGSLLPGNESFTGVADPRHSETPAA